MIPDDVLARVFPAPAGINRAALILMTNIHCVPRASGDKPPRCKFQKRSL
ncbi:hypothetical protein ECBCE006MS23_3117 [Escherichia coli BCE006_MS-23]|nr:hypothetical protein ECBCE019MS13_3032 [Escherichia coli BCE019_MS-13]ENA77686.1 hypothetical protein EC2730450_3052 [Escherichia coli 2730450]ENA79252.1 hypothetical protein EC2741950_3097 [Escherichia coli 2741950]ENB26692.1 hypothetical protein ECBCE030MS09_3092 [Escherichia coli BCE030_MS-09]ENB33291.1 hypothetical protein ECBCE032MS12_3055 [Escherichia coli BCE032_MS-12]END56944.1 hypothetical protein ECBCE006MS23_3117 [Escherichia coli BCE006_MS-23]